MVLAAPGRRAAARAAWLPVLIVLTIVLLGVPPTRAQAPATQLLPTWNLLAAPASGPVRSALGDESSAIVSVHRWDAGNARFASWFRDAPTAANSLTHLDEGDGLWVSVDQPTEVALPDLASVQVGAQNGWQLVGWTQSPADASDVLRQLGARRLFGWDADAQAFRSLDPAGPAPLNTLTRIDRGAAIWAFFGPGDPRLVPAVGGRTFDSPIEMAPYPGGRVFVAEQTGLVRLFDLDGGGATTLLDLGDIVSLGFEEGLLSIALAPDFETSGYLYAYFTVANGTVSRLARFQAQSDHAALSSELRILDVPQPFDNHNGGAIRFGPDGFLYLGFGDGGSADDPLSNGQNLSTLLGSIIRIDVSQATAEEPYRIPVTNPFVATPDARGEIFAYGFRNPWRMSFDPESGRLWAGDVGQDRIEEIDIVERGGNYGWNRLEGDACLRAGDCSPAGTTLPVATYANNDRNCAMTGGLVYRGSRVPAIADSYLFADFCSGRLWAVDADEPSAVSLILDTGLTIASFGQDADGEAYLLTFEGQILRITQQ